MHKININEISDYFTKTYIGSGTGGDCFLTADNKGFKKIKFPGFFENNIIQLCEFESESFCFPETLVYLNDSFIGYIYNFADGVSLEQATSINLYNFNESVKKIEKEIKELSLLKLYLADVEGRNIIIDNNSNLKIIDTDYSCITCLSHVETLKHNISLLSNATTFFLFNKYPNFKKKYLQYVFNDSINGRINTSLFFDELLKELKTLRNNESNSINDISYKIKKLLK